MAVHALLLSPRHTRRCHAAADTIASKRAEPAERFLPARPEYKPLASASLLNLSGPRGPKEQVAKGAE